MEEERHGRGRSGPERVPADVCDGFVRLRGSFLGGPGPLPQSLSASWAPRSLSPGLGYRARHLQAPERTGERVRGGERLGRAPRWTAGGARARASRGLPGALRHTGGPALEPPREPRRSHAAPSPPASRPVRLGRRPLSIRPQRLPQPSGPTLGGRRGGGRFLHRRLGRAGVRAGDLAPGWRPPCGGGQPGAVMVRPPAGVGGAAALRPAAPPSGLRLGVLRGQRPPGRGPVREGPAGLDRAVAAEPLFLPSLLHPELTVRAAPSHPDKVGGRRDRHPGLSVRPVS